MVPHRTTNGIFLRRESKKPYFNITNIGKHLKSLFRNHLQILVVQDPLNMLFDNEIECKQLDILQQHNIGGYEMMAVLAARMGTG